MKDIENNKAGLTAECQVRLRETINKEVDIYISEHPSYISYREDLKGEVFVTIVRRMGEEKPDSYLKQAAKRTLYQKIRDISDVNRTSHLQFLNNCDLREQQDDEESQDEACSRMAEEQDMASPEGNPRKQLEGRELLEVLERQLQKADSTTARLIRDRIDGIPIRDSAALLNLPKSTAFELISKFRSTYLKAL